VLDKLTSADFRAHLKDTFTLSLPDGSQYGLTLVKVSELGDREEESGRRRPFSLIFRGPLDMRLSQQIYLIIHAKMGSLQIFIVPVGPDQTGQCYEAIFN
jgi:hypothetical protein